LGTEHGWIEGDCFTYGCRTSYHCAVGYELQGGRPERVCQNDGSWYPKEVPNCVREYFSQAFGHLLEIDLQQA
jgi:hypothetical protein